MLIIISRMSKVNSFDGYAEICHSFFFLLNSHGHYNIKGRISRDSHHVLG